MSDYDAWAPVYDTWATGMPQDLEHYVRLAAEADGPIVELAVGTGRVALEIVRRTGKPVLGIDSSPAMLEIARERIPGGRVVQGDAVPLPFQDGSFDRVFTGHFYGHLRPGEREQFVAEALRVARELVVVDSHVRPDHDAEEEQERTLNDGSVHTVYKRYFTGAGLAAELACDEVLHVGDWFVMVRVSAPTSAPSA